MQVCRFQVFVQILHLWANVTAEFKNDGVVKPANIVVEDALSVARKPLWVSIVAAGRRWSAHLILIGKRQCAAGPPRRMLQITSSHSKQHSIIIPASRNDTIVCSLQDC